MKIAFTHNLKLTDAEEEAEFDTVETVNAIAGALTACGHEVEKIEVSGPASHLAARIEAFAAGVDAYLVRPNEDLKKLGEKVAEALGGRGGILLG